MVEVEIKFRLADAETFLRKLQEFNSQLVFSERTETDEYFLHPARDFRVTDEALRIRCSGSSVELTWKGPKLDALTKSRQELELPVNDAVETAAFRSERLREILLALGFVSAGYVRKHRRVTDLTFGGRSFHVSLDTVEGLGLFAEIETLCPAEDRQSATKLLLDLAAQFDLGESERRSYIGLLQGSL